MFENIPKQFSNCYTVIVEGGRRECDPIFVAQVVLAVFASCVLFSCLVAYVKKVKPKKYT